jgi:diguanylate cyclase (GGDEF)-like protein
VPHTVLSPRAAGIDFYGDTLFTSEARATKSPARVAAFREASVRGWRYAMDNAPEIADLILARYSQRNSREQLLFEAGEMRRLMQPELIEVGHMNPDRWRHIAEVYADLGMLPRSFSLEGFMFQQDPRAGMARLYGWLVAAVAAMLAIGLVAAWQARLNRNLRRAIRGRDSAELQLRETNAQLRTHLQEIRSLQHALEEQAIRDPLTGLYNRRYLDDTLERELRRAERQGSTVSVLVVDIDHFKRINDTHGHAAGDEMLKAFAALLRASVRGGDLACRWGGEEFVLLLHAAPSEGAAERAEALRLACSAMQVHFQGVELRATVSIGVACFPAHASTAAGLMRAADEALYAAKGEGRNRVKVGAPVGAPVDAKAASASAAPGEAARRPESRPAPRSEASRS